MQLYADQVQLLCQQLKDTCGPDLKPQAVSPHVYPGGSGSAVCQLVSPQETYQNTAAPKRSSSSSPTAVEAADSAAAHESAQAQDLQQLQSDAAAQHSSLPELQQLLSSNQQLLVTFLVDTWKEQQQLHLQQQQHTADAAAADCNASAGQQDSGAVARSYAAAGDVKGTLPCSRWMHAEMQQFLGELERGTWATAAAAAAASVTGCQQPVASPRPSAAATVKVNRNADTADAASGVGGDTGSTSPNSSGSLLRWLSAAHPTAAVAVNGVLSTSQSHQQQLDLHSCSSNTLGIQHTRLGNTGTCSIELSSSSAFPGPDRSAAKHVRQQQMGCSAHPNIQPVLLLASNSSSNSNPSSSSSSARDVCCMIANHISTDAQSLLCFSPGALGGDWYIRFLLYQLLQGLVSLHSRGLALGGFSMQQVNLIYPGWLQLLAKPSGTLVLQQRQQKGQQWVEVEGPPQQQQQQGQLVPWPCQGQQQQQQQQQRLFVIREPSYSLPQLTEMWRTGVISNLEYLLWLNAAAGRSWGDRTRHPYVPWVIDFSVKPDLSTTASSSSSSSAPQGFRDLGISQYRRIKGDAQLDQTYAMSAAAAGISSSTAAPGPDHNLGQHRSDPWAWPIWGNRGPTSDLGSTACSPSAVPPHHISNEPMSELSYAIYMARRLPVELLVSLVRRSFRPEEYPRSLEGLYHSSPDEALPQFYTDPQVFQITHTSMSDLAVPSWATDAHDFIKIHRAALESDYVSANLHRWIDLNFGIALSGLAGLAAKNIHLKTHQYSSSSGVVGSTAAAAAGNNSSSSSSSGLPVTHGVCQLFDKAHPPRCCNSSSSSSSRGPRNSGRGWQQHRGQQTDNTAAAGPAAAPAVDDNTAAVRDLASKHDPMFLQPTDDLPLPPSPGQLAQCWREIASLEAAAAMGTWQPAAAATGTSVANADHAFAQQQQMGVHNQQQLVPAFAADLAAVGQAASQLYQQQQHPDQLMLSRSVLVADDLIPSHNTNSSSKSHQFSPRFDGTHIRSQQLTISSIDHSNIGPDDADQGRNIRSGPSKVPAAAALFIQQCQAGHLSARGLMSTSFFPLWMETAWHFMVKLLYSQQQHSQHYQPHCDQPGSSSSSSNAQCWQQCDAFESLARLAGPSGELQQLAQIPEAMQLCLPTVMHIVRSELLLPQAAAAAAAAAGSCIGSSGLAAQHQQQLAVEFVDSVCLVLLRLASVLPPVLVQQQLLPLLQDMLATEQQECLAADAAAAGPGQLHPQQQQQQQQEISAEAIRVSACRRAALQPLLWQILLAKLPQQQLLQALLPPLLAAVLEQQHDCFCACCLSADHELDTTLLLPHEATAAAASEYQACNGDLTLEDTQQQQQQQQQYNTQARLACSCLVLLAESLPFPVVCQHILRPLLLALPYAGSTACTARESHSTACQHSTNSRPALSRIHSPNGAAAALLRIGQALPAQLAAQFVLKRVLQVALLPLLSQQGAAAASSSSMGAATVSRHTAAALPILEGLMAHVLPIIPREFVTPHVGDFRIAAYTPAAGSSSSSSAAAESAVGGPGSSRALRHSTSAGSGSSSSNSSMAAAAAAATAAYTSPGQQQQQQQQQYAGDVRMYHLADLLLLLPPDSAAVHTDPLLYPRIVALLLSAIEDACTSAAASSSGSSSSTGVNALLAPGASSSSSSNTSMAAVITYWLLPQVLLPLLSPGVAAAWQQQEGLQRTYWRCVLLLYAAAVRVLGLKEARAAVSSWHSAEVWLTTETGWEPQLSPKSPLAADATQQQQQQQQQAIPHTKELLRILSDRDAAAAAAATAATAGTADAEHNTRFAAAAGSSGSSSSNGSLQAGPGLKIALRRSYTDLPSAAAAAAAATATAATGADVTPAGLRSRSGRLPGSNSEPCGSSSSRSSSSSNSNISGRVSHLLQRIAEEKVVRRNLNTTNEFLQGVGWSQPRPLAAAAAEPGSSSNREQQKQQQRSKAPVKRALSAPLAAAATAAAAEANGPTNGSLTLQSTAIQGSPSAFAAAAAARDPATAPGAEPTAASSPPAAAAASGPGVSTARRRSWATELSELRLLLESPARHNAAERGPSAGKEWFWLLNPQHEPTHLLPSIYTTAGSSSSSSIGSSRPWRSVCGVWWEEGWSLSASVVHAWPAHREKLRALAVDPGERWVVTAGRSAVRSDSTTVPPSPSTASVVRVWELSDAETKVQYTGHAAAVHKVTFLGAGSSSVASLDVSGAIHVWDRATGAQLNTFIPADTSTTSKLITPRPSTTDLDPMMPPPSPAAAAATAAAVANTPASAWPGSTDTAGVSSADTAAAAAAAAAAEAYGTVDGQQLGTFFERGCSSSRGWQDQPALYTSKQLSDTPTAAAAAAKDTAAAAASGSVMAAAPAAALVLGGRMGYTCMTNPASEVCPYAYLQPADHGSSSSSNLDSWWSSCSALLAGTADGHVCTLDMETGALLDDMVASWEPKTLQSPYYTQQQQQQQGLVQQQQQQQSTLLLAGGNPVLYGVSGWEDPLSSVITAVCCSYNTAGSSGSGGGSIRGFGSSWIAAGSGSGRVTLLDSRAGAVLASWQAHSQRVSQLQGLGGFTVEHQLLSCSQDKTLKVWDLRMLRHSRCWPGGSSSSGVSPLAIYKGSKDGIDGFAVYQDAAIVYGGPNLGLAPLDASSSSGSSSVQQQQQPGWSAATGSAAVTRQIRMTGIRGGSRGLGGATKGNREGLGAKVPGFSASIVGLGLLPNSKLLVVGHEDGQLKICK